MFNAETISYHVPVPPVFDNSWPYSGLGDAIHNSYLPNGFHQDMTSENAATSTVQDLCQNGEVKTQLHRAVIGTFVEEVKALLFNSAVVDSRDHAGNEPLHYAVLSTMCLL